MKKKIKEKALLIIIHFQYGNDMVYKVPKRLYTETLQFITNMYGDKCNVEVKEIDL